MLLITLIGCSNQLFIKTLLINARLVARNQHNRASLRVESKRHALDSAVGIKTQLLHVSVL